MNFILGILESLLAAIILSYILKIIFNRNIKQFLGEYYEITQDGNPLYKFHYTVSKLGNALTPFSRYTLKIVRVCKEDDSSWIGEYYSDFFTPYYFKGAYLITKRENANKSGSDRDGWHELNLFPTNPKRIAVTLNFLNDNKQWSRSNGYFIEKYPRGITKNKFILNRMRQESEEDTRKYLVNCHNNYSEYVQASKILFPYYYQNIDKFIEAEKDCNKSIELRKEGNFDGELEILINIISKGCSAPGIYRRAATIFKSKNELQKAEELILKWFDGEFWKVPNMCAGSLKLLDMLEGLENKL